MEVVSILADAGFRIILDDFGTGFSSFAYLYRIPTTKIKIDKSFVDGIPHDPTNASIVKSFIAMFHSLDKTIIAEGVETAEQAEFLTKEGCNAAQGFYYSHPLSLEEARRFSKKAK
jgi:EAL domain-containing protein (putative c-di-GMP-specific phosphodiesterase class I)